MLYCVPLNTVGIKLPTSDRHKLHSPTLPPPHTHKIITTYTKTKMLFQQTLNFLTTACKGMSNLLHNINTMLLISSTVLFSAS